jgi:hypothetical protein
MRSDAQKKISIIILTASAFFINAMALISGVLFIKGPEWIIDIRFGKWGWIVVMGLAGYALKETRNFDFTSKFLKVITITLNILALVYALVWFRNIFAWMLEIYF